MISYFLTKRKKFKKIIVIIESRSSDGKIKFSNVNDYKIFIKKIFETFGIKNIFFYDRENKYYLFNFKNFFCFKSCKKKNIESQNKLKIFFSRNKINIKYDEVWFTNDLTSKIYLNLNSNMKKIYFFHGLGDIMILYKKNYIKKILEKIKFFINEKLYNYYLVIDRQEIQFVNFFNKYYNKKFFNKPNKINLTAYEKILKKLSKKSKQFEIKKKRILITDNINLQKFKTEEAKTHSRFYAFCLVTHFKKKKINLSSFQFFFKWKGSVPNFHKKIFINEFKKHGIEIIDIDNYFKKYIPLELILLLIKPLFITSNYSSINFVVKDIFPKIKILSTKKIYLEFLNQYKEYHRKNNLNHLLKNSEKIKKLVNSMPFDECIET